MLFRKNCFLLIDPMEVQELIRQFPHLVNRLEAFVLLDNERSSQVLNKLGFVEEGILREYGFWKERFWDMRCFSLLKREWSNN